MVELAAGDAVVEVVDKVSTTTLVVVSGTLQSLPGWPSLPPPTVHPGVVEPDGVDGTVVVVVEVEQRYLHFGGCFGGGEHHAAASRPAANSATAAARSLARDLTGTTPRHALAGLHDRYGVELRGPTA